MRRFGRFAVAWPVCLALTGWVVLVRVTCEVFAWLHEWSNLVTWACWRMDGKAMQRARNVALWAYGKEK